MRSNIGVAMNIYLVTDYPTLDETRQFAVGLVLAASEAEARELVIQVLIARGLKIGSEHSGEIVLELWNDALMGTRLFFREV